MRSLDLKQAVHKAMTDSPERRFVLAQCQEMVDKGWHVSNVRMNVHSEVFVNLWRPGNPIQHEYLAFFRECTPGGRAHHEME